MGCKMDEDEEALCIIRDFSGTSQETKVVLHIPPTMTVREFIKEVARKFNYEPDSMQLVTPSKNFVLNPELYGDDYMKEKVNFVTGSRNLFVVEGLNNGPPSLVSKEDELEIGASSSPGALSPHRDDNASPTSCCPSTSGFVSTEYGMWNHSSPHITPETSNRILGFRGLVNQAMTCYLNSLIQALYMTPEFRNGVYSWKFNRDANKIESKSIPFQLQKLFLNLQTSKQPSVHTTELTRSFGWDSSEAWQQHDIQELCRVMFDALEHEFKGTENSDLIERMYGGKLIDYVKCLECGVEKKREDKFLDIPLPIRPYGSIVAYSSIEEALRAFVKPETLEGHNQYFCDNCDKKCDAHKGLKFSKFPYLFTLHLMRFDYDFSHNNRVKLNDTVAFPEILNLNSFISSSASSPGEDGSEGFPEEVANSLGKCDDGSTTDSNSAIDDELSTPNDLNGEYEQEADEGIDVTTNQENEKNRKNKLAEGPCMYELFVIMVHSGSAAGGHYYVLIKDMHSGNWYSFNDQTVTPISREEISRLYGSGSKNYYNTSFGSSSNAYMLMYRQIDKERNRLPMTEDEFPDHIKELMNNLEDKSEMDLRIQEREKETCKIKVFVQHPTLKYNIDVKIECSYNTPLSEVTQLAYNKLQLEYDVPLERCRLVLYNSTCGTIEGSLDGRDDEQIGGIISKYASGRKGEMWMDFRQPDADFVSYKPSSIIIPVSSLNVDTEVVDAAAMICCSMLSSIGELRSQMYEYFHQDPDQCYVHLYLATFGNTFKFVDTDSLSLKDAGFYAQTKLYVCFENTDNRARSRLAIRRIVDKHEHTVRLNITLPSETDLDVYKNLLSTISTKNAAKDKHVEDQNTGSDKSADGSVENAGVSNPILPMLLNTPPLNADDPAMSEAHNQLTNSGLVPANLGDQSTSEDSSLTDSDRTIICDIQHDDCPMLSSKSSPTVSEYDASPTENLFSMDSDLMNKFLDAENYRGGEDQSNKKCTFKEISLTLSPNKSRNLVIEVDRRLAVDVFKKLLEQYVGVATENFKLYDSVQARRDQDLLCSYEIASLDQVKNEEVFYIKLSRAGDFRGKVFYLQLNQPEMAVEMFPWTIDQQSTVAETKKELLEELANVRNISIPLNRCRLRKKCGRAPGQIYDNHKVWTDLNMCNNWEMYIQQLETDDEPTSAVDDQYYVLLRKYNPSSTGDGINPEEPFTEALVQRNSLRQFRLKISDITGIPLKCLVLGKESLPKHDVNWGKGIQIEWLNLSVGSRMYFWPFIENEDDFLIYYRDSREDIEEVSCSTVTLSRAVGDKSTNKTLRFKNHLDFPDSSGTSSSVAPVRKERALKIYIDKPNV